MIIVGAKGFAKELLEVLHQLEQTENLVFFDNISTDLPNKLYGKFDILKNEQEVQKYIANYNNKFCLGIGGPKNRKILTTQFTLLGLELHSVISNNALIGSFNTTINTGACIMPGTIITNDVIIGKGTLINLNCTIGHDTTIGEYCELCPGVHVSGNVVIGSDSFIGTGAVILPNITIGNGCVIGAGSVVTKDVPDNMVVKGIPAK